MPPLQHLDEVREDDTDTPLAQASDPQAAAVRAQLRYVSDTSPGITRHAGKNGFDYRLPDGGLVRDVETLRRIRSLAIPPAWTEVWICPPRTVICRRPAATRAGASSTAIIRAGARCATRRNTQSF